MNSRLTSKGNAMKKSMLLLCQLFISLQGYSQYVGIGTTNPIAPLTIQGDAENNLLSLKNNLGNDTWHWWLNFSNSLCLAETAIDPYRLTIRSGGRIGIGNPFPACKLDVIGEPYSTLASFNASGGPGQILVGTGYQNVILGSNEIYGYCGAETENDFSIRTGAFDRIYITNNNGFVGLGTYGPLARLDVQADENATIGYFQNTTLDNANIKVSNGANEIDLGLNNVGGYVGTTSAGDFRIRTNNSVRMYFNSVTGHVGIDTDNPTERLTVNGNIKASMGAHAVDFGLNAEGGYVGTATPTDFRIRANSTIRMYVRHSDGYVGIGTETPLQRLHVIGNIALTGNIIVEAPTTAVLENGWVIYNSDFGTPQYSKDKQNRVLISGLAGHSPTTGGVVFTLPLNYRPAKSMYFLAATDHPNGFNRVLVNALNGEVSVSANNDTITWVSFDNIIFRSN